MFYALCNKISPASQTVAMALIAPKICQGQPPTMYSKCSRFHPNRFTFGGVITECVNTAKLKRRVNPIFGDIWLWRRWGDCALANKWSRSRLVIEYLLHVVQPCSIAIYTVLYLVKPQNVIYYNCCIIVLCRTPTPISLLNDKIRKSHCSQLLPWNSWSFWSST